MNSHIASVMAVYEGVFVDANHTWPHSIKFFEKDLSYLRRACQTRGLSFFTMTLPAFGKVIEKSLEEGYFLAELVPQGIPMIKKRPELFGNLYMKLFDEDGILRVDLDVNALSFLRQFCYLAKKLRVECSPSTIKDTLDEFFNIEASLPSPHYQTWDSDIPIWTERKGHPLWGVRKVESDQPCLSGMDVDSPCNLPWHDLRALARRIISEIGLPLWWELAPKHGPGAVSDGKTAWKSKYDFPFWPRKLAYWFPFDWYGSGLLEPTFHPSDREPYSKLVAVPKDQRGPRLICAEPIAHQWMQQSIWSWLEERVERTTIGRSLTFRSQERSRNGALQSSLTRNTCTVDLSSASDRVSCRLVEYIFQGSEILDGLHAVRTRAMSQEISRVHPRVTKLKKFTTQGSSLTFPVQSIIFTILSVFALRVSEGRTDDWFSWKEDFDRVIVYGDDLIVPSHAYEDLKLVLHECGLKVNSTKSFVKGFFRESCGMDAYMGIDITPKYLLETYTGTPESTESLMECANNFHFGGYWHAALSVISLIPQQEVKLMPVVSDSSGHLGLRSYTGNSFSHLLSRWNGELQVIEYSVLRMTSKVTKVHGRDEVRLSQFFFEDPDPELPWSSGQAGRVRRGKRRTWASLN